MEENEIGIDEPHSVEISINKNLEFSGKTKCYGKTGDEAMERTINLARRLELLIKEKNQIK